jgi:SAM-dependent methyltransferase
MRVCVAHVPEAETRNSAAQPSFSSSAWQWWTDGAAQVGHIGALRRLVTLLWEFFRQSMPERRRRRFGDFDFDWDHRVDTTSATIHWRDRLLGLFYSPYQPSEPALFHQIIANLDLINFSQYTFVDIGSGKGRALLMAADYPFRRILGVELLAKLHALAEANIGKYKSDAQRCFNLLSVCEDASHFQFPAEPMVVYLFDPLPEQGLAKLLKNLEQSLLDCPRSVYLLYHNPTLEDLISGGSTWRPVQKADQYSIFCN